MEPFKNLFSHDLIRDMADHFSRAWAEFDKARYIELAGQGLEDLELKQRSDRIEAAMEACLPDDFDEAARILLASLHPEEDPGPNGGGIDDRGIRGWAIMPMTGYVGRIGRDHLDVSLNLMKEMTKRFSSEFGIRFLLLSAPEATLATLSEWTKDPSHHVRRLVSEGTRTRLPWAMRLSAFIDDPSPILPLLEALKDDPEEYVRRSVANNLNDIAKDHPDLVAKLAKSWLKGASKDRRRLIRHALRSLIKQGHEGALAALGYREAKIETGEIRVGTPIVELGGGLEFALSLKSKSPNDQPLIVDYAVHHRKANGTTSPKVFKWKTLTLAAGEELTLERRHPMRPVTTRVYYPGLHHVEVLINGKAVARADFDLKMT
ncbi:MAG: DNA alkylation repair protein [Rhodospirillales bacterium]|nr:DNA alkylation repair protein [Rhodospirillales bacterium]